MLTLQQLSDMADLQDRLNRYVDPGWRSAGWDWNLAIMAECTELIDQVGWKWWKHQTQAPLTQIQLEVVDIWHFVLSQAIVSGRLSEILAVLLCDPRPPSTAMPFVASAAISAAKQLCAAAASGAPLHEIVGNFYNLLRSSRLSFDELTTLYKAKAVLNLFRWSHGYKQGSYVKQWGEVEDNVYLESILHAHPNLPHEQINTLLEQRYQEVTA